MLVCFTMLAIRVSGQVVDRRQKVVPDSLTFAERLSLNTNSVDWLLLMPNIGVEFDLRGMEWSKWALGLKVRANWQTEHTFKPAQVYNLLEGRIELKHYYRIRLVDKYFSQPGKIGKLFSNRKDSVRIKHPNTTYYHGGFLSFSNYSMMLIGSTGRQGMAITGGAIFGMLKPLYQFSSGNSLDVDLGFSVGLCLTKADEYGYDRESNCYPILGKNGWKVVPFPIVNEARVAFVYRFGRGMHKLTAKYRDRYDVDEDYRTRYESRIDSLEKARQEMEQNNAFRNNMQKHFEYIYNKVYPHYLQRYQQEAAAKAQKEAEMRQQQAEQMNAAAKQKTEEKPVEQTDPKEASVEQPKKDSEEPTKEQPQPNEETEGKENAQ